MGSHLAAVTQKPLRDKTLQISTKMASTRAFSNISNISEIPRPVEGKRVTRASRKALADITSKNINLAGKENGQAKPGKKTITTRQTKVAARRLPFKIFQADAPMEVEEMIAAPVLPPGVKDIDVDDHENPQLCSEYALETYVYLKQLEKRAAVPSNYLTGCSRKLSFSQSTPLTGLWLRRGNLFSDLTCSWLESLRCFWSRRLRRSTLPPSPTLSTSRTTPTPSLRSAKWS